MDYILDACSFLAFLNDEEGGDTVEELLLKNTDDDVSVSMSIVNLLEVYYSELRDKGVETAQVVLDMVQYYSVKIINTISDKAFHEAARMKTTYKMSLGDCIGLATALEFSGKFVTSDHHELDPVAEKEPDLIFWYR